MLAVEVTANFGGALGRNPLLKRHVNGLDRNGYVHAKRLKTLSGLTPHEFVCAQWQKNPAIFTRNPTQLTLGLSSPTFINVDPGLAAKSGQTPGHWAAAAWCGDHRALHKS